MSDTIEEELNLPKLKEVLEILKNQEKETDSNLNLEAVSAIDKATKDSEKLEKLLENNSISDEHETEMNEIRTEAMKSYRDMIDLGFNIDPKHAGDIMAASVQMLKLALDASNSKIERRFRQAKLQLDKRRLELNTPPEEGIIQGEGGFVADRNDILKKYQDQKSNKNL